MSKFEVRYFKKLCHKSDNIDNINDNILIIFLKSETQQAEIKSWDTVLLFLWQRSQTTPEWQESSSSGVGERRNGIWRLTSFRLTRLTHCLLWHRCQTTPVIQVSSDSSVRGKTAVSHNFIYVPCVSDFDKSMQFFSFSNWHESIWLHYLTFDTKKIEATGSTEEMSESGQPQVAYVHEDVDYVDVAFMEYNPGTKVAKANCWGSQNIMHFGRKYGKGYRAEIL